MEQVKLQIADKLKARLEKIDSPIAKYILSIDKLNPEDNNYINFLDISSQNPEFISYMNKQKLERFKDEEIEVDIPDPDHQNEIEIKLKRNILLSTLINNSYNDSYRTKNFRIFLQAISLENINLCIENNQVLWFNIEYNYKNIWGEDRTRKNIFYLSKQIWSRFESASIPSIKSKSNAVWEPNNRLHGRAGKTFRRIVPEGMFNDKEWEYLSAQFKLEGFKMTDIEGSEYKEVTGELIKYHYHEDNTVCTGDLGSSCMREGDCQDFFGIYIKNPKQVSLAVITLKEVEFGEVKDLTISRCLLWKGVEGHENTVFFDRIYAKDEKTKLVMKAHMESLGYKDIWPLAGAHIRNNDYAFAKEFNIKIEHADFELYPYMDSFRYLDVTKGILSTKDQYERTLNDTNGYWEGYDNRSENCSHCGDSYDIDELNFISAGRNVGEYMCSGCCEYSNIYNTCIANSDSFYCKYEGERILFTDGVRDHRGDWIYKESAVMLYNDDWAHKDDDDLILSADGECFIQGDEEFVYIESNGEYYKQDSSDISYDELTETWMLAEEYEDLQEEREKNKEEELKEEQEVKETELKF